MLAKSSNAVAGLGVAAVARVLLVESSHGSLATVAAGLDAAHLGSVRVLGHGQAGDRLRFDSRFSLCISDAGGDHSGRRELCYRYPELPWIVHSDGPCSPLRLRDRAVTGRASQILAVAMRELREHPYDQAVLDAMDRALCSQWAQFGSPKGAQFVRHDARLLDAVSGIVEVAGHRLWGRVIFSASEKVLYRQARRVLGSDPESFDEVVDTAAECANRLASDLRRHYRAFGLASTQSAPVAITGAGARLQPISKTPSLVVEHRAASGDRVYFEWQLGTKPDTGGPTAYGELPTGEPVFL